MLTHRQKLQEQLSRLYYFRVFNHGTYHHGQLVNMLRQLGAEKIPQTDFIVWSRKK